MFMDQYSIKTNEKDAGILAFGYGWIAVDKAAGVSIHNDPGKDLCSRMIHLLNHNKELAKKTAFTNESGVSPVHRIDRDTSGVVLLGLQKEITAFYARQFQERSVEKKYVAVVHGCPESERNDPEWNTPLSPKAGGRKNPAGAGRKVPCVTKYRVLERSPHYSLIECELVTGRKHQIRRHAKVNKTPIAGDKKYGSPRSLRYLAENCSFSRLALHSQSLGIKKPDGERLVIDTPIPPEFIRLIKTDN